MAKQGFIGSLFDFSFSSFVTPTIIKIIYGLALLGVALGSLAVFGAGAIAIISGELSGAVFIILSPIYLVLGIISSRVYCELLVVAFRVIETLIAIETNTRGS